MRLIAPLCGLQVVQVACGVAHTLLLTKQGQVLSFGSGRNGRLGYALEPGSGARDVQLSPRRVELPTFVRAGSVACGSAFSAVSAFARSGSGAKASTLVFTFGKAGPWLGQGPDSAHSADKDASSPQIVEGLGLDAGESLVDVSCGQQHMACCSSEGRCWTWGAAGEDGKLGHVDASASDEPLFLTLDELTSTVYPDQRAAYTGLRMSRKEAQAAIANSVLQARSENSSIVAMREMQAGCRLPEASFGICHLADGVVAGLFDAQTGESLESLAALPDEDADAQSLVFVRGSNEVCASPRSLALLRGFRIVRVAAGRRHTLFLTSEGLVLACGDNQYGQLGLGAELVAAMSASSVAVPTKVPLGAPATHIAAGARHSVALGRNQHVFTWGQSELIGRPDGDPYLPGEICFEGGVLDLVRDIAVGDAHTVVSTAFGHCIGFGRNHCRQLGVEAKNEVVETPTLIETSLFAKKPAVQRRGAGAPDFASLDPKNDSNLIITAIAAGGGLSAESGHTIFLSSSLALAPSVVANRASGTPGSPLPEWKHDRPSYVPKEPGNKPQRNFCVAWRPATRADALAAPASRAANGASGAESADGSSCLVQ